mmetsp:Transcript_95554/g.212526  ORF Transcript_95554/g.212526 Transcript_95554/m.212526 type:complete len:207 (+) Transcript_95554:308-928(+)
MFAAVADRKVKRSPIMSQEAIAGLSAARSSTEPKRPTTAASVPSSSGDSNAVPRAGTTNVRTVRTMLIDSVVLDRSSRAAPAPVEVLDRRAFGARLNAAPDKRQDLGCFDRAPLRKARMPRRRLRAKPIVARPPAARQTIPRPLRCSGATALSQVSATEGPRLRCCNPLKPGLGLASPQSGGTTGPRMRLWSARSFMPSPCKTTWP